MKLIELNIQNIIDLCKKYRVKKLYVIGSILTDRFNDDSDVDFSFNFEDDVTHHTYPDNFFGLYYALKSLFGRDIDLVDETSVSNKYFRKELDGTKNDIWISKFYKTQIFLLLTYLPYC